MIIYSKNLLKNFKLLRENDIQRRQVLVVLDIDQKTYQRLYSILHKREVIEGKYTSSSNWIKLFNDGLNIFRIMSKYPEITSYSTLELYFRNQFVSLELNETVDKSNSRFIEWLTDEYVNKRCKLKDIANEYGYNHKALRSACEKFKIRRSTIENRKISNREVPYTVISKHACNFLKNPEEVELLNKALAILTETNNPTDVYTKLNVSPRYAKRLYSDYNILKADQIPFTKIMRLINEGRLTLREINLRLKLPRKVQFYINHNIFASLLIGKSVEDLTLEENRKCIYPTMCGDNTYITRAKGRPNIQAVIRALSAVDPDFLEDLNKIKVIIEHNGNTEVILSKLGCTEDELKSLMTKYYIDEYMKGGNN